MMKGDTIVSMTSKGQQKDFVSSLLFSFDNDPMFLFAFNGLKEKQKKYKPIFLKASKGGFFTKVENDYNCVKEFEQLISYYLLVITVAIKKGYFHKANEFFLLMINESEESLTFIFEKLVKNIPRIDLKTHIGKYYPKMTICYLKICSCLIKLSGRFSKFGFQKNLILNYTKVILLVYQQQMKMADINGKIKEKRNIMNYIYSNYMFNLSFFKVWNFSPLSISIALFDKIKKNYSYKSEVDLTSIENSLLIKSLFDIGVLLYVDNNSTEAFSHLQQANELFLLNRLGIKEFDKITNNYKIARKHNSVHYSISKEQTKEEIITTKTPRQSQICDLNEGKILIRIELMLGEIELDKQNFIEAYQHVKSAIYLLKSFTEGEYITHNTNQEIEKAAHFLAEIEKQYVESIEQSRKTIERIDFNNKLIYTPKMSEDTKQTIEEIEKFFLFLSTLSIYQIKVLNDFQPKQGGNRDYLPIMFPNQFKDCLTYSQRVKLDQLKVMGLLRYIILQNPKKEIYPSNLNFDLLSLREKSMLSSVRGSRKTSKVPIPFNQSKEYYIIHQIITSSSISDKTRNFLKANQKFVVKILKKSNEQEKQDILENPEILVEPIKDYINMKSAEKRASIFIESEGEIEKEDIIQ